MRDFALVSVLQWRSVAPDNGGCGVGSWSVRRAAVGAASLPTLPLSPGNASSPRTGDQKMDQLLPALQCDSCQGLLCSSLEISPCLEKQEWPQLFSSRAPCGLPRYPTPSALFAPGMLCPFVDAAKTAMASTKGSFPVRWNTVHCVFSANDI